MLHLRRHFPQHDWKENLSKFYRATFNCKGKPGLRLTIDIAVLPNKMVSKLAPMSGWWGIVESDDIWPFVLQVDGELDFGNSAEAPFDAYERYGYFDIHTKVVAADQTYSVRYKKDSHVFDLIDIRDHEKFDDWPNMKLTTEF
jgi:hypothetical protein